MRSVHLSTLLLTVMPVVGQDLAPLQKLLRDGHYTEVETRARVLLKDVETTSGPDSLEAAKVIDALAASLYYGGKSATPEAPALAHRAVVIKERVLGPEHRAVAASLNIEANIHRQRGAYSDARPLLERALRIWEGELGNEHPNALAGKNNLAILLQALGELDKARDLLEEIRGVRERTLAPDDPRIAKILNNLAMVLVDLGLYADALPLQRRAVEIWEEALPAGHPSIADGLNILGWMLYLSGDPAAARPLFERALTLRRQRLGADHPLVSWTRENLALSLEAQGQHSEVLALLKQVCQDRRKQLGPGHPDVARAHYHLARALAREGDLTAAIDSALLAEDIGREHLRWMASALAEREALLYREARDRLSLKTSGLDLALSLAMKAAPCPKLPARLLDHVIRSRALVLDELAERHQSLPKDDVETVELRAEVLRASERYAQVKVRGPEASSSRDYRQLLDLLRDEKESAERALAQRSFRFRASLDSKRAGLREVSAALPTGSALVAYARHQRGGGGYLAFLLRAGGSPELLALGRAAEIDRLVARWGREASLGTLAHGRADAESGRAYWKEASALREKIWDPVRRRLGRVAKVYVVPDGRLHLVNLAALPADESRYLVETGPLIHYLSAERDLAAKPRATRQGRGLLAMGGPSFDSTGPRNETLSEDVDGGQPVFRGKRSECLELLDIPFEPLPAALEEVQDIAGLWAKRAPVSGDALVLTGAAASEAAFKAQAPGRRAVHLATHGFFLAGRCASVRPGTRGIQGLTPAAESLGSDSLLLAGLALAGANRRSGARPGQEDGILTAEEIAALDLSSVDWAVLSACDTGVGDIRAGEGVLGLRRAFQVAGAGSLVLSLWAVEDAATGDWMRAFYAAAIGDSSSSLAQAVRDASLQVLRERRRQGKSTHPLYWGAFVAAGRE